MARAALARLLERLRRRGSRRAAVGKRRGGARSAGSRQATRTPSFPAWLTLPDVAALLRPRSSSSASTPASRTLPRRSARRPSRSSPRPTRAATASNCAGDARRDLGGMGDVPPLDASRARPAIGATGAALLRCARLHAAVWLVLPLLPLRLWWRGRREPGYRRPLGERFGVYARRCARDDSGSTRCPSARRARPCRCSRGWSSRCPRHVLLTHMTATGRAAGRTLSAIASSRHGSLTTYLSRCALPRAFEAPCGHAHGDGVWPNLTAPRAAGIPLLLVNARLSGRSLAPTAASRPDATDVRGACRSARKTQEDAQRLREAGVRTSPSPAT